MQFSLCMWQTQKSINDWQILLYKSTMGGSGWKSIANTHLGVAYCIIGYCIWSRWQCLTSTGVNGWPLGEESRNAPMPDTVPDGTNGPTAGHSSTLYQVHLWENMFKKWQNAAQESEVGEKKRVEQSRSHQGQWRKRVKRCSLWEDQGEAGIPLQPVKRTHARVDTLQCSSWRIPHQSRWIYHKGSTLGWIPTTSQKKKKKTGETVWEHIWDFWNQATQNNAKDGLKEQLSFCFHIRKFHKIRKSCLSYVSEQRWTIMQLLKIWSSLASWNPQHLCQLNKEQKWIYLRTAFQLLIMILYTESIRLSKIGSSHLISHPLYQESKVNNHIYVWCSCCLSCLSTLFKYFYFFVFYLFIYFLPSDQSSALKCLFLLKSIIIPS